MEATQCTYNLLPLVLGDDNEHAARRRQHSVSSLFDRLEELDAVEPRESVDGEEFISLVTGNDDNDAWESRGRFKAGRDSDGEGEGVTRNSAHQAADRADIDGNARREGRAREVVGRLGFTDTTSFREDSSGGRDPLPRSALLRLHCGKG